MNARLVSLKEILKVSVQLALHLNRELQARAAIPLEICSILLVLSIPAPGPYIFQGQATLSASASTAVCDPSLADTSWISSLPRNEQFLANKLTRMEAQSESGNVKACSSGQDGFASIGLISFINQQPTECAAQYRPESDPWIASQTGVEKRFIMKELRNECASGIR